MGIYSKNHKGFYRYFARKAINPPSAATDRGFISMGNGLVPAAYIGGGNCY
jgi:hypothetical protein